LVNSYTQKSNFLGGLINFSKLTLVPRKFDFY